MLEITSIESLDSAVAEVVRLRIRITQKTAEKDAELASIEKRHQTGIHALKDTVAAREREIAAYCAANRAELFKEKKSRETTLAVFGFEITPPRVEPAGRRIKWTDVVSRLLRLQWGHKYLRLADPKPDKDALLADREKLLPEQLDAIGIRFEQDEQFYIRPKPETAAD